MPGPILRTFGTFGPFTLTLNRDTLGAAQNSNLPATSLGLYLTNGADVRPVSFFDDTLSGQPLARAAGEAILAAYATAGAAVTIGGTALAPLPATGTADTTTAVRSAVITPGTPVPPGRAAFITPKDPAGGNVILILPDGSKLPIGYSGTDTIFVSGLAVVGVDPASTGSFKVSVAY